MECASNQVLGKAMVGLFILASFIWIEWSETWVLRCLGLGKFELQVLGSQS